MNRIGVVGLDWRQATPERLERYTLPKEGRAVAVAQFAREVGLTELVYLATCNRIEWTFVTEEGVSVEEYRRRIHRAMAPADADPSAAQSAAPRELRAWEGEGAVEHIMLVTMGLDSAQLGESEILGQVRDAFGLAREAGLAGDRLIPLFQEALKLAKKGRTQTGLHLGRTSLAEIGLDQVRAHLVRRPGTVTLLGVSPMTERCARELVQEDHQVLIVNRTRARAEEFAQQLGPQASALSLNQYCDAPPHSSALLSATGCEGPLLARSVLNKIWSDDAPTELRPLLVDFATDPDFDPELARELGFDRLGMAEILAIADRSRAGRLVRCGEARSLVDDALQRMSGALGRRKADRAICALREAWLSMAMDDVELLIAKHFRDTGAAQADALRQFASRLANRFAHLPSTGLRHLAQEHGEQLVDEFFEKSSPELAGRLAEALDPTALFASLVDRENQ